MKIVALTLLLLPCSAQTMTFTVQDSIVAFHHILAGGCKLAAIGAGAETAYYDTRAQEFKTSAASWSSKKSLVFTPILKADLKNPLHVAGLTLGVIIIAKLINAGIDLALSKLIMPTKK
jgi:hypothetical protein